MSLDEKGLIALPWRLLKDYLKELPPMQTGTPLFHRMLSGLLPQVQVPSEPKGGGERAGGCSSVPWRTFCCQKFRTLHKLMCYDVFTEAREGHYDRLDRLCAAGLKKRRIKTSSEKKLTAY